MKISDKEIIEKVIDGIASQEESKLVTEWFSTTTEGQNYLSTLIDRDMLRIENNEIDSQFPCEMHTQDILTTILKRIRQKKIRTILYKVAAVLIPFVFLVGLGMFTNSQINIFGESEYVEIYAPKGEKIHVFFQDGSEAYLNSDSRIRYPRKFSLFNRKIYLDGEAYFNITTNKFRPFIVDIDQSGIKVTGTMFNVKAYKHDDLLEVVLEEGKIMFNTENSSYPMAPGQLAVYDKINHKISIRNILDPTEISQWRNNYFIFKDAPLAEVLKTINRRFNIDFNIRDPKVLKYTYTLSTRQTSVEKLIDELEIIAPVRFKITNNIIDVSGN
jgi:ferric-dicitrate binding protein FerR (iron transport regulator)